MKVEEKKFEKGELIFTPNHNKMLLEAVMRKSKIIMVDGSDTRSEYYFEVIAVGKDVKNYSVGQKIIANNIVPYLNPKFVIKDYTESVHGKRLFAVADTVNDWQIDGFLK
jgi:threonine dehydrogenase-like Zn-dependent dehydrogenase